MEFLKLKMQQTHFPPGHPAGGAYDAPQTL